jgi:hypothetical protein
METQTKRIFQAVGLAGIIALTSIVGNLETKVFDGKIGKENVTLFQGFDYPRYVLTKIPGYKQTLVISNADNEVYVFKGRKNGTLLEVKYTRSNGQTECYSKYSDKIKSLENMFKEYQNKVQEVQN